MRASIGILMFVAGVAACAGHTGPVSSAPGIVAPSEWDSARWVGHLEPIGFGNSVIYGDIKVGPGSKLGDSHAVLSIQGARPGAELGWIIRTGRCGDVASSDLGLTASYRWLEVRGDGTASLQVELPKLVISGSSHVEVMSGPGQGDRVAACGNLSLAG